MRIEVDLLELAHPEGREIACRLIGMLLDSLPADDAEMVIRRWRERVPDLGIDDSFEQTDDVSRRADDAVPKQIDDVVDEVLRLPLTWQQADDALERRGGLIKGPVRVRRMPARIQWNRGSFSAQGHGPTHAAQAAMRDLRHVVDGDEFERLAELAQILIATLVELGHEAEADRVRQTIAERRGGLAAEEPLMPWRTVRVPASDAVRRCLQALGNAGDSPRKVERTTELAGVLAKRLEAAGLDDLARQVSDGIDKCLGVLIEAQTAASG